MLRSRRGLTVLELVIIVVIIGVLLLIVVPRFTAPTLVGMTAPDSVVAQNASGEVAVKVTSRRGAPQSGVKIQFESSGGVVTPSEVETDSTGTAKATWKSTTDSVLRIVAHPAGKTTPEVVMHAKVAGAPSLAPAPTAAQPLDSTSAKKDTSASAQGAARTETPAQTPAAPAPSTKRP